MRSRICDLPHLSLEVRKTPIMKMSKPISTVSERSSDWTSQSEIVHSMILPLALQPSVDHQTESHSSSGRELLSAGSRVSCRHVSQQDHVEATVSAYRSPLWLRLHHQRRSLEIVRNSENTILSESSFIAYHVYHLDSRARSMWPICSIEVERESYLLRLLYSGSISCLYSQTLLVLLERNTENISAYLLLRRLIQIRGRSSSYRALIGSLEWRWGRLSLSSFQMRVRCRSYEIHSSSLSLTHISSSHRLSILVQSRLSIRHQVVL